MVTPDSTTDQRPDLELARRYLESRGVPGRVLLCGITGSHYYGFASPDSDLDLKGIHLAPIRQLLGLGRPPETFDRIEAFEGRECDITLTEARSALDLLLRGNGNMLERVMTPYQLVDTAELAELRALALAGLSRRFFRHYQGFFRGTCREHERAERPTAKGLLYAYRVALTGIHLLRTGELVADLRETAPQHGYEGAIELIAIKQAGIEHGAVTAEIDARHREAWARLASDLEEAHATSPLPEQPANAAEVSEWLCELRLRELTAG